MLAVISISSALCRMVEYTSTSWHSYCTLKFLAFSGISLQTSILFLPSLCFSIISSHELTVIRDRLPDELKREMDTEFWKRLKFEFHPADYHVLLATTTGLKNATGHLVKVGKSTVFHACMCRICEAICFCCLIPRADI